MAFVKIRSRNKSANQLRKQITTKIPTVVRLGSFTPNEEIFTPAQMKFGIKEINTVKACQISNDKLDMKKCFDDAQVDTSKWFHLPNIDHVENNKVYFKLEDKQFDFLRLPCIIKHRHSSKGEGIYYMKDEETLNSFLKKNLGSFDKYIIEQYYDYSKEYRFHATSNGIFYGNRKMLKNDVLEENRFHRHHENTVWILPENPLYDTPLHFKQIEAACVKAIKSIGLEIACLDVLVSRNDRDVLTFKILETNSAPALGEETSQMYIQEITKLLKN